MSLIKTDIKKTIKKELGVFLKKYDYRFDANAEGFVRYFEGGFNKIGMAIFDYRPKFQIAPFFLIRFDAVENIVQKHVVVLEKYKDVAYTTNTGIEYFTGTKEYEIRTESELRAFLSFVMELYSSRVESFFKLYSIISNLDNALNIEKLKLNKLIEPDNCIRSIIISRLSKNPNFEMIAESYYRWYVAEYNSDLETGPTRIRQTIDYLQGI